MPLFPQDEAGLTFAASSPQPDTSIIEAVLINTSINDVITDRVHFKDDATVIGALLGKAAAAFDGVERERQVRSKLDPDVSATQFGRASQLQSVM